jgi:hypothetical protein
VCIAGGAQADLPVPAGDKLMFRVLRGDSAIGTHALRFTRRADTLEVRIEVDLRVGFGPITLYRYTLRATERWRGGQVEMLDASTDDDGTPGFARAIRDAQGLWVEGSGAPRYLAPRDALPSTHWNVAELNGAWINPQNGKLLRPAVARRGLEQMALGDGRLVAANRYALSGAVEMNLWYDAVPSWIALDFTAHDGSLIRYERI